MTDRDTTIIFLVKAPDQKGLVASISNFFFAREFNITRSSQYTDLLAKRFYMRVELSLKDLGMTRKDLESEFEELAENLKLEWSVHYTDQVQRVALLVSRTSHCLYDLLLRWKENELPCEIPLIISNHPDLEQVAGQFRIPYHYLPIKNGDKDSQELVIRELLKSHHIDLVVLARYMQILSPEFTEEWPNRIINIHHAFLPAFQGGNTYQRAYERGVKMIGATAHYATQDLDQGPIIEQDVERVMHEQTPHELKQIGKDIERVVLSRAVKSHLDRKIIVSGKRTIVFR